MQGIAFTVAEVLDETLHYHIVRQVNLYTVRRVTQPLRQALEEVKIHDV